MPSFDFSLTYKINIEKRNAILGNLRLEKNDEMDKVESFNGESLLVNS